MNDMIEEGNLIYCPKCGEKMRDTDRCCIKCGTLNYNHPANANMRPYFDKNVLSNNLKENIIDSKLAQKNVCLIFNLAVFVVIASFLMYMFSDTTVKVIAVIIGSALSFIYSYAMQLIYMKAGKDWWSFYIPFYNIFIFFEITMNNGFLMLLLFIPIVGIIVLLKALYNLGVKFGRGGFFTLFLSFIALPLIAFSQDSLGVSEQGLTSRVVDDKGRTLDEIKYRRKRVFVTIISIIAIGVVIYFAFPYVKAIYKNFIEFISTGQ